MPNFSQRANEQEIMDDFSVSDEGLLRTLKELDTINHLLGGNAVTLQGLGTLLGRLQKAGRLPEGRPLAIADLGCGSGTMLRLVSERFGKKYGPLELVGIDANPAVVAFAQKANPAPSIRYEQADITSAGFATQQYDIVLCTLFLHHFERTALETLLVQLKSQARLGVVVNDLHRHWFAYHSIHWLTALFSRSYMTRFDAKLSVRRAFLRHELEESLAAAGWKQAELRWKWAFRWQLVYETV